MSKTKTQKLLAMFGVCLTTAVVVLAVSFHFQHFYEMLVLGLFLALQPLARSRISRRMYISLYFIFLAAGVICDLVMGIYITGLWHYSYTNLWDYFILYFVSYPIAGLVMVQTYVLIKTKILKIQNRGRNKPIITPKSYRVILAFLSLLFAVDTIEVLYNRSQVNLVLFFALASFIAFFFLSYVSQIHGHKTIIEDIHRHPAKSILLLVSATYLIAMIQEIPNTYAKVWVYTNWPLADVMLARIPVTVLLLWPLLLLIPVAGYYLLLPSNRMVKHAKA